MFFRGLFGNFIEMGKQEEFYYTVVKNWAAIEASNPVPYNNPDCRPLFQMS